MTNDKLAKLKHMGYISPDAILVESYWNDFPQRLQKEFGSKNWFVLFIPRTQKYEIHYDNDRSGTHEQTVPFDTLDDRMFEIIRVNRAEKAGLIIQQITAANELKKQKEIQASSEIANMKIKDGLDYKDHHPSKDLDTKQMYMKEMV